MKKTSEKHKTLEGNCPKSIEVPKKRKSDSEKFTAILKKFIFKKSLDWLIGFEKGGNKILWETIKKVQVQTLHCRKGNT